MNIVEFVATLFFGIYSIADAISVVISGFQNFTPITAAGLLTYASIAWAHNKRTKQIVSMCVDFLIILRD